MLVKLICKAIYLVGNNINLHTDTFVNSDKNKQTNKKLNKRTNE